MKDDVHQPLETAGLDLRDAGHRLGSSTRPDDAQAAAASVTSMCRRAGRRRPWLVQAFEDEDVEVAMLGEGGLDRDGAVGQRRVRPVGGLQLARCASLSAAGIDGVGQFCAPRPPPPPPCAAVPTVAASINVIPSLPA